MAFHAAFFVAAILRVPWAIPPAVAASRLWHPDLPYFVTDVWGAAEDFIFQ